MKHEITIILLCTQKKFTTMKSTYLTWKNFHAFPTKYFIFKTSKQSGDIMANYCFFFLFFWKKLNSRNVHNWQPFGISEICSYTENLKFVSKICLCDIICIRLVSLVKNWYVVQNVQGAGLAYGWFSVSGWEGWNFTLNFSYRRKNMYYKWQENCVLIRHKMYTGSSLSGKLIKN